MHRNVFSYAVEDQVYLCGICVPWKQLRYSIDLPDEGVHVASIYEERVIAAGIAPHIYHLTYQGETLAKVPTSSNAVYSIIYQETPQKVLSIAGSSNNLDICTNFNYRELMLKFA